MEHTIFTMSMPIDIKKRLRRESRRTKMSMAEVIVTALVKYFEKQDNKEE